MTGVAAIALCAAFTSCSKGGDELYDPDHGSKVIAATYEEAFRNVFGNPAPTQEWGFGNNAAKTRSVVDPNGNMWKDAPTVLDEEPTDVKGYVEGLQTLPNIKPTNLVNYFVTHIWKGKDTYTAFTGGAPFTGSDIMDQLIIASKEDSSIDPGQGTLNAGAGEPGASGSDAVWQHVYDFNAGANRDYSGNMLMTQSGTKNFAYWNSKDNKWHDRWIAVKGADIDAALGVHKYAGYWYICFDYEGTPKEDNNSFTVVSWKVPGNNPGEYFEQKMQIQGIHTLESLSKAGTKLSDNKTGRNTGEYTVGQEGTTDWHIDQISQGDKYTAGDGVYTDWIIRLVEAEPTNDPPIEENKETDWIRVFGEDLNANDPSDFDFNDVVIDIKITKTGAECILQAAGGTMPLRINGDNNLEVHKLFGVSTDVMVNTNAENTPDPGDPTKMMKGVSGKAAVPFTLTGKFNGTKSVKIEVNKGGWQELTAERGVPASKIGVPQDTAWPLERVSIKQRYPLFTDWVTTNTNYQGVWY